jgi:menaquinol-cytochrome c reductase iron-sulfur subunit
MSNKNNITRRNFMSMATWAIGGLIGLGMGIPAITYVLSPAKKNEASQDWISLGSATKVELNTPTLFKTTIKKQTGWIITDQEISIYILTENGRDFIAMSNICTHLGCRVRWISEEEQFFCPCHNGIFNKDGNVAGGPPPRPLDRFEVKVEGDQLYIFGG